MTCRVLLLLFLLQLLSSFNTAESSCQEELDLLRLEYKKLRKDYGALYCEVKGIGPSGGFCLKKESFEVGGNQFICRHLALQLKRLFANESVYDFGAGLGHYGKFLLKKNPIFPPLKSYVAFDGAENVEEITDNFVNWADLSKPIHLEKVDWILSLEVGEHIPPEFEGQFIDNLVNHAKKGIVLSWAVPKQRGHHHVNCRPNSYVKERMLEHGFFSDEEMEEKLRALTKFSYFKKNLMVFRTQ